MAREARGWPAVAPVLGVAAVGALVWAERRHSLRKRVEPALEHHARNLAIAGLGAITLQLAERPVIAPLARLVERRRIGLLQQARLPQWLETALAVVLLDYTLYQWHALTHRVPLLWRFHEVHHADRDLDASTALRFHFGEFLLGIPWRAAQVLVIGVDPRALAVWQRATLASILFHHSNLRLSAAAERRLSWLIMTPRLHGIHHSVRTRDQHSNWSSGLTVWDRLHGTFRASIEPRKPTIGVEGRRSASDVTLRKAIAMPFERKREPAIARRRPHGGAKKMAGVTER